MTAEIAILNRVGVALAADSAVTISSAGGDQKTYNSANKLFALDGQHPVAIMIHGSAESMGIPAETIMKRYKSSTFNQPQQTLAGYARQFADFMRRELPIEHKTIVRRLSTVVVDLLAHVRAEAGSIAPAPCRLHGAADDRTRATSRGKAEALKLRTSPVAVSAPPPEVDVQWSVLHAHAMDELFAERDPSLPPPAWWRAALFLVMVSDKAARDLGFEGELGTLKSEPASALDLLMDIVLFLPAMERKHGADSLYSCSFANQNVVGVLPKSRTPAVGCTLRSLSHNLALVPPGGEARVRCPTG